MEEKEESAVREIDDLKEEFGHPEDYLYSLERIGEKLCLEKIENFLSKFDDPQKDFESILVGGTNGKGSVCRTLASILEEAGYRTGLYLSPHLIHFEERIQVDNEMITEEKLWSLLERIHPVINEIEENDPKERPSFFEVLTTIAFLYFSEKDVDIAILEVGMGGRLDATNVAPHDFSVTTYVGYDHSEHLGETKEKIAYEKAGIIHEGNFFVTGEKDPKIRDYFKDICKERNADFNYALNKDHEIRCDPLRLAVPGYGEMEITGVAPWQAENVLLALKLAEGLRERGFDIEPKHIVTGIEKCVFPGKMETVKKEPWVVMDSAHNKTGFKALEKALKRLDHDRLLLVIGMLEGKDHESSARHLGPLADKVFTAEPVSERKFDSEELAELFGQYCPTESFDRAIKALEKAEKECKEEDLILVTGSLYLLGDIRRDMKMEDR